MEKHCSIILVNWNGWQDTIECLETIFKQDYQNFSVVLVDNGSDDESVEKIESWAKSDAVYLETKHPRLVFPIAKRPIHIQTIKNIDLVKVKRNNNIINNGLTVYLILNSENLGFAKANNIAIRFALNELASDYIFLLNNDTVIERNCLSILIANIERYQDYEVLQPSIYYYEYPEKIWNVGGIILPWAQSKYFKRLKNNKFIPSSFVTGCALFLKSNLIKEIGLFSEKFFHGEEDFEFSMRLKQKNKKAAVVVDSKVYHKIAVSASKQWKNDEERILNFALNRLINLRDYLPNYTWKIWRIFT
jgi:GT2 family glycosyltransferase